MPPRPSAFWLALCAASALGCITEYQPEAAPLDEGSLAEAIRVVEESEAAVELQEGGLQITAFLYERSRRVDPDVYFGDPFDRHRTFVGGPPPPRMRLLSGPAREVFLPYDRIEKVEARSWPLWDGVEIDIGSAVDLAVEGPLVIEVGSKDEARRLTDALDLIRRARLLEEDAKVEAPTPAE